MLLHGGNAVDAAVAAVAAQGVVAPETCGVGGDLFALIHAPGWDMPRALNSSGRAGSGVDADDLRSSGLAHIPSNHPAAVTIPGCVDGMEALIEDLGQFSLTEVLQPAIALATDGFPVSTEQASQFSRLVGTYGDNPAVADFYTGGRPVTVGETVTRLALAQTLQAVASGGRSAFYEGTAGEDISTAVGGLITMADMTQSQAEWIEPIGVEIGVLTAWTTPPNSQGYLGPATLAVFEMLDPPDDPSDAEWWHLLIEAYRCLAWERNDLVADPGQQVLPAHLLLQHDRLQRAASAVDPGRAGNWPPGMGRASGTAYLCVADADGMTVSIIQSNYRGTGSPFGAARSGFLLQDRGTGFSLTPGHPNELNPGKRPLHTLSPTLWTEDGQPRWALGTRGGAVQPQLVAQVAALAIIGGADLDTTQSSPRWTVAEFGPGSGSHLAVEPGVPQAIVRELENRGHMIEIRDRPQPRWGPVSIIEVKKNLRRAAADPRVDTAAALVY